MVLHLVYAFIGQSKLLLSSKWYNIEIKNNGTKQAFLNVIKMWVFVLLKSPLRLSPRAHATQQSVISIEMRVH